MADRRNPATSLPTVVTHTAMLPAAFAVVASSAATARSQETEATGGLPDGAYSGGIYFKMDGSLNFQRTAGMAGSIDTTGDATLVIDTDASSISGVRTLEGTGATGGEGTSRGARVTISRRRSE